MAKFKWTKRDKLAPTLRADFVVCWLKSLVHPFAKQTVSVLEDRKGACCCMGIACNVAGIKKKFDHNNESFAFGKEKETEFMPKSMRSFLKMKGDGASASREFDSLTELNDCMNKTFLFIAKYIQKNCRGIFDDLTDSEYDYIQSFKIPTRDEIRAQKRALRNSGAQSQTPQIQGSQVSP